MADPFTIATIGLGAYNTIKAGRERRKVMDRMGPYLELIEQTARGGGPLIESAVGNITQAGERGAQIASRSALSYGRPNRARAQTLATGQRIGASRGAAVAAGQIRSAALSPALGGQFAGNLLQIAENRGASGATSLGFGLKEVLDMIRGGGEGGGAGASSGPMSIPEVPDYQFQIGLPGRSNFNPRSRWSIPHSAGGR